MLSFVEEGHIYLIQIVFLKLNSVFNAYLKELNLLLDGESSHGISSE